MAESMIWSQWLFDLPLALVILWLAWRLLSSADLFKAVVLFIIPREDAEIFSPNWEMDPKFSQTLQDAQKQGVHIIAYSFQTANKNNNLALVPKKRIKVRIKN